jgi:RNA polymerase sigma factor (sigma-70 family)
MAQRTLAMAAIDSFNEIDETSLVAEARRDRRAFGRLYALYVQPLFRYLYSRIGGVPEAEDVTAQTFLAALEAFGGYRHDGHFAAWLFGIARNKAADYFRQQRKQAPLEDAESLAAESDLLQGVVQNERSAALAALIAALPEADQELIRLRYVAELNFSEIGRLLGRSEEAAKKALYRLLARLQSQLENPHA